MNNLKELHPVPNSIQTSSEDPLGFIYPTYRLPHISGRTRRNPWRYAFSEESTSRGRLCLLFRRRVCIHTLFRGHHYQEPTQSS